MVKVVSIKFRNGNKPYYFSPCRQPLEKGMNVIVETSKGLEYATVAEAEHEVEDNLIVPPLMPVVRVATPKDDEQVRRNDERRGEALKIAREKIAARGLEMKPVGCEFSFDGNKVIIYFTAENRVDFRELIKDLSAAFRMRIELRQIGIRDEIKLMGGLATCGRECCCVRSLQEPKKVSVKMAKNQGLSLNPGKISGLCGRLMCCLSYENDYYAEAFKQMPKIGSEADTPDGKGTVVNVNMLSMTVKVKIEQGDSVSYRDFALDQIAFMRGNELIGKVGVKEEEADAKADGADIAAFQEIAHKQDFSAESGRDGRNARGRQSGKDADGGQDGEQPRRGKHNNPKGNNGASRVDRPRAEQPAGAGRAPQGGGYGNNRNRKKKRSGTNTGKADGGINVTEKPKNNA